jgi:hypothetical protein
MMLVRLDAVSPGSQDVSLVADHSRPDDEEHPPDIVVLEANLSDIQDNFRF